MTDSLDSIWFRHKPPLASVVASLQHHLLVGESRWANIVGVGRTCFWAAAYAAVSSRLVSSTTTTLIPRDAHTSFHMAYTLYTGTHRLCPTTESQGLQLGSIDYDAFMDSIFDRLASFPQQKYVDAINKNVRVLNNAARAAQDVTAALPASDAVNAVGDHMVVVPDDTVDVWPYAISQNLAGYGDAADAVDDAVATASAARASDAVKDAAVAAEALPGDGNTTVAATDMIGTVVDALR